MSAGPDAKLPLGLLAAAGFLSSAGARVVDPLLHPIAREFGVGVPELWIIIAAFTLPYGLNQLVLGPVGDRFGKLRVILGALIGYALFTGVCAMASSLSALALWRAFAGASSAGLIPVGMAYIGDAVPYERRQVTLSKFLTGVVLAQVLAAPVGGIFGEYLGWRGVFLVLSALAVLLAVAFALQIRGLPDRRAHGRMFNPYNYIRMARHRTGRLVLLAAAFDGALFVGCFPYLAPYLHERFGLGYAQVGLILACFGLGALLYTRFARRLLTVLGESGMVLVGGLLMASGLALAVVCPSWWVFVPIELMLGLGFFMLHSVLQAQATEMLPRARATAVATFACLLFLGQSVGALLVGAAIARWQYGVAFLLDAAGIATVALWLWRTLRRPPVAPLRAVTI
ncbi:MAG: MFS transporter [Acetobacteraceae bacterium]